MENVLQKIGAFLGERLARVERLFATKTEVKAVSDSLGGYIRGVSYQEVTGVFTFTFGDGSTVSVDLPVEDAVTGARYDGETQELVMEVASGVEIRIPAAGMQKVNTGGETVTTVTRIGSDGRVTTDVREGAIDAVHLAAALQEAIHSHLERTGDSLDNVTTFTEAAVRANIESGESHSVLFGKIRKWFSALGALAFRNTVTIAEVDNLQSTLNTKADISSLGTLASKNVVAISEVTNLQSALDGKADSSSLSSYIPLSQKGSNSGVAELDGSGKVLSSQLPSYVDNVDEFDNFSLFPRPGISERIYIDKSTNKTYRWGGSDYVTIGTDLALGETAQTAYRGDRGKIAYDYSQGKRSKDDLDTALQEEIDGKINNASNRFSAHANTVETFLKLLAPDGQYRGAFGCQNDNVHMYNATGNYLKLKNNGKLYLDEIPLIIDNDPRLLDARPANDVSAWAKSAAKPGYTAAEVGGIPNFEGALVGSGDGIEKYIRITQGTTMGFFGTYENATYMYNSPAAKYLKIWKDGRLTYDEKPVALIENIPTSLPANGGSALTLSSTLVSADNAIPDLGKFQVFTVNTGGPSTLSSDGYVWAQRWAEGDYTTQLFLDANSTYGMYLRHKAGNGSFNSWRKIVFADEVVHNNNNDQYIGGNLSLNTTNSSYVEFKRGWVTKGYIGCGATASTDIYISNLVGGNNIALTDDGKNLSKGKEIATIDQIPTTASQIGAVSNVYDNRVVTNCNDFRTSGMFGLLDTPLNGPGPEYLSMLVVNNKEVGYQLAGGYLSDRLYFRGWETPTKFRAWFTIAFLSDIPTNFVTTDTTQTITGAKTFSAYCNFTGGAGNSSDRRLKKNIKQIKSAGEKLSKIRGYEYTFKEDGRESAGVIAQDVEKVLPVAVKEGEDGYLSVESYPLLGLAIEAINELREEVLSLKAEIEKLKSRSYE